MRITRGFFFGCLLVALQFLTPTMWAQQPCPAPQPKVAAKERIIFSQQQEMFLGDAIAEQIEGRFRVIQDEEVTARLQKVGERLTSFLVSSEMKYRFMLVDAPEVNAWAAPGGRIYVTRKLVAAARSEDELAGVVAHELGHIATRQIAADWSRNFNKVLGVTELGDRKDVFEKYHEFLENRARKSAGGHSEMQEEQLEADQMAVYLATKAGYDVSALATFWDRIAETKGKTGSALGNFFGLTKPEEKRLRELMRTAASLPPSCTGPRVTTTPEDFQKWQATVVGYSGLGRKESLVGIASKRVLDPPLQNDIDYLRFSPDGNYLVAQEDSGIYVLSRNPFKVLFRIDAPEANNARFSPDSKFLSFHNNALRVETWGIAEEQRTRVHEVTIPKGCLQNELSPDGKYLICLTPEFHLNVHEVATSAQVFQKKNFISPDPLQMLFLSILTRFLEDMHITFAKIQFTQDGRYFAAGTDATGLAMDLSNMSELKLPGSVKKLLNGSFAFYGSDRLLGTGGKTGEKTTLVRWPSGEVLRTIKVGNTSVSAPSHGEYVLLRPIDKYPVGVMNLETEKIFLANRNSALDVYDKTYVSERRSGELALYDSDLGRATSSAALPRGKLGRIRAASISPDGRYVAISQRSRGGVWDTHLGDRLFQVRGFRGAFVAPDGIVYADFPKYQDTGRMMGRLDLSRREALNGPAINDEDATQYGEFLVLLKPKKKGSKTDKDVVLEVHDVRIGSVLWSHSYSKERPGWYIPGGMDTMVLWWNLQEGHAKDTINANPALKARVAAMKEKEGDYLLEVVEARTGKTLGMLLVETGKGSFTIERAFAVRDYVIVEDSSNRVLVYQLSTNELKGRYFGSSVAVALDGSYICTENEAGKLTLYDLPTLALRNSYTFAHPVSLMRFRADGKQLFVLTADQTVYLLDTAAAPQVLGK